MTRLGTLILSLLFIVTTVCASQIQVINPSQLSSNPQTQQATPQSKKLVALPMPPKTSANAKSWVLMDFTTGQILAEHDENQALPPASLTKLMTAYVVLQSAKEGLIKLSDKVRISAKASKTPGSKTFLKTGEKVSVENLMKGMIIQSGNDAAVALAQHVAGSQSGFAAMMNSMAQHLGMTTSHFVNPNGLPATHQVVSAYDMAILARALIRDFPKEYKWYSQEKFTWNGITQYSRNKLMRRNATVDGLKTGYTRAAKYCLVASSVQNGTRLIAVIMGAPNPDVRADEAEKLLTYGYRFYRQYTLFNPNQSVQALPVVYGAKSTVNVGLNKPIVVMIPRGQFNNLHLALTLPQDLTAPVQKGKNVGTLKISLHGKVINTIELHTLSAVAKGNWWQRATDWVKHIF